ncbi:MAG: electron transfer flavoprotein subunit beta/FixA family protein [Oscillospiraceae bacterium]|jgi:electron transfer flavoprotein beta subunit|nr:electron transfer flavoprotein subunit beta/FixA family protein [Oscillospiraceae bacterium]
MKIAVCIKQVPAGAKSVMDPEKGLLARIETDTRLNPYDAFAIEAALQIAEKTGGTLTAFTMGPPSAGQALREALAMGVQAGVLLTDRAFAGADVAATSHTLGCAIKKAGGFDLIVCGQQTTDGDTAQVPFALGACLGVCALGWVTEISEVSEKEIFLTQELSGGSQTVRAALPACIAVGKGFLTPRLPSLAGRLAAKKKPLTMWGLADMADQNPEHYGLHASPTRVRRIYAAKAEQKASPIREPSSAVAQRLRSAAKQAREEGRHDE